MVLIGVADMGVNAIGPGGLTFYRAVDDFGNGDRNAGVVFLGQSRPVRGDHDPG